MILLVVLREEFHKVGDGLVRDVTEIEVLQRLMISPRYGGLLGSAGFLSGSLNGRNGRPSTLAQRGRLRVARWGLRW